MLTPQRWALVIGIALAVVALVGAVMVLLGGQGGGGWVIVGFAAVSSLAALTVARAQRRGESWDEGVDGPPTEDGRRA
ncbi:hypothetical protein [Mobilicoccus massiliensis]|uniref:hypothetical protein n=1 Tax=Mobilicoccus massiliensis TaxID=1522310 RepID=UPI00058D2F31|nr:hypothetical protein [Mobilicoccus massiliensis]